jgi:hypothetical protein
MGVKLIGSQSRATGISILVPWSNLLATGTGHWARVVIEYYYVVRTGAGRGYEYESKLSTVVLVMVSSYGVLVLTSSERWGQKHTYVAGQTVQYESKL